MRTQAAIFARLLTLLSKIPLSPKVQQPFPCDYGYTRTSSLHHLPKGQICPSPSAPAPQPLCLVQAMAMAAAHSNGPVSETNRKCFSAPGASHRGSYWKGVADAKVWN